MHPVPLANSGKFAWLVQCRACVRLTDSGHNIRSNYNPANVYVGTKKILLSPVLLSTNSCFALWAIGRLETILFGFLILTFYYLFLRQPGQRTLFLLGMLFSLATMTRSEGIIFFGITGLFCFFQNQRCCNENIHRSLLLACGFLIIYLPYTFWRIIYFDYLLPCPVYAKGGTNLIKILFGGRYVFHFITTYGFSLAVLVLVTRPIQFLRYRFYLLVLLAVYCFYVVIVSSDHMHRFRFFVPVLPIFYLLIQDAVLTVRFRKRTLWFRLFVGALITLNFFVSYYHIPRGSETNQEAQSHSYKYKYCFAVPDAAVYYGKITTAHMRDNWPVNATVALNAAGAQAFYSDKRAIDMLGLNNYTIAMRDVSCDYDFLLSNLINIKRLVTAQGRKEILKKISTHYLPWQLMPGHAKGNGNYVLSLKPDYIIIGDPEGSDKPWFWGDRKIMASPE